MDWGEAAGDVSSMYSTPKSERAVALGHSQNSSPASPHVTGYLHLDLGLCVEEGIGELFSFS